MGADPGGARSAAIAEAPGQAGAEADVGELLSGDESGAVPKAQLWSTKGRADLES